MLKRLKNKNSLLITSGLIVVALIGATLLTPKAVEWLQQRTGWSLISEKSVPEQDPDEPSPVLALASLPAPQRDKELQAIAASPEISLDRSRARYLLAVDLIQKYEGGPAILQLEKLEEDYPVLGPYILLKRGRAYELTNETEQAQETWQKLIEVYPDSPVVGEALYELGKYNPEYWDRAIANFPNHPRTQEIARKRLQENPQQLQLLLLLAKYDPDGEGMNQIRDRLVKNFTRQLTPQDWEVIATGYWNQGEYGKAAQAYPQAPRTPRNAYRIARGLQLDYNKDKDKDKDKAKAKVKAAYEQLIQDFPEAPETGLGLRRLASLLPSKEALVYLDLAVKKFPDDAPEALVEKAKILDTLGSKKSASQARQMLINNYADSEAAVQYRWSVAQKFADGGDLITAWQWAQPITQTDNDLAPKAAFWIGKWAEQLGRRQDGEAAFKNVLSRHPQSYYAWRSALRLGLDVGDFTTVRQKFPTIIQPKTRTAPPTGSASFQELYRLNQDQDASMLFQAEIGERRGEELTVDEQFTEGLLRLTQGKNLQGINLVWNLKNRDEPQDRSEWQELRQTSPYWHALFPFPFNQTILDWSEQRQLNPLLVTSLIRQESRFEPKIKSPAGALGLMQVMPETGQWVADKISLKDYSLTNPNDNVKLGTWYLDYTHQEYNNNSLLAIASYNAGPGNVAQWIKKYGISDGDVFVEKIPFPETRGYIESVFANYWNYLRIYNPQVSQLLEKYTGLTIDQP